MQTKDIQLKEGDVFTWLTLTGKTFSQKQGDGWNKTMYEAICKCGVIKGYQKKYLLNGNTKSCGCYKKIAIAEAVTSHHLSKHPIYQVWQDMIRRCYKRNCKSYKDYGARGIRVCDLWLNDIKAFFDWAISHGWEKGLELDRENNDGNYTPENCRFVTRKIGNQNTRRNVFLTAFGETKCMSEWLADKRCKVIGNALKQRLQTGKWTPEEAITTPSNYRKKEFSRQISTVRNITAFGETKTVIEWSEDKRCKVTYAGLKTRLRKGFDTETAISSPLLRQNKKAVILN